MSQCDPGNLGQHIRPQTTTDTAKNLVEKLYGFRVTHIKELVSYDDRNYHVNVEEVYTNPYVSELWAHGYILKILNSAESQHTHVDGEHVMQKLLNQSGIHCPQPVLNLDGKDQSKEVIFSNDLNRRNITSVHIVRLLTYQEGQVINSVPYTSARLYNLGLTIANIHNAAQGFDHPTLKSLNNLWNLQSIPNLTDSVYAITNTENRNLVLAIIDAFKEDVVPSYPNFTTGVIHGDINEQNIVVKPYLDDENTPDTAKGYTISAVIDFAEVMDSYLVFDVAIAIMSMMLDTKSIEPVEVGGYILAGYFANRVLNKHELEVMKTLVASRFCQCLTLAAVTYKANPDNDYLLADATRGWNELKEFWHTDKKKLYSQWRDIINAYK